MMRMHPNQPKIRSRITPNLCRILTFPDPHCRPGQFQWFKLAFTDVDKNTILDVDKHSILDVDKYTVLDYRDDRKLPLLSSQHLNMGSQLSGFEQKRSLVRILQGIL